jgi:uncharacterized protein
MSSPLLWTLIALQVAMGAFDTLYHHELTERLRWRPSQRRELVLHSARNLLYAGLLVSVGWSEPHGLWAWLVMAVLVAEIIITLVDFVEEDSSRKLPASERINHTLLAINYGMILALMIPVLLDWSKLQTTVVPTFYGAGSLIAGLAACGVILFGALDLRASRRLAMPDVGDPRQLVESLALRRVLVTGATGFIGRRLVEALTAAGHDVTVLARNPLAAASLRPPFRLVTALDEIPNGTAIDAIINLAGEPIANRLWTTAARRCILRSRLKMTRDVVRLIARLEQRPAVLISGSGIGWYGLWEDEELTEFDGGKSGFTHRVCEAWERAAKRAERYTRVVRLRIGLVLGVEGGLLARLLTPFEFGLGGPIGSGRQWMSWIERDDLVRLIAHVIATPSLTGAINATAPTPVRNAAFARELGRSLRRPALLKLPALLLHLVLGDFADELLIGGQRVLPDKAQSSGFRFRHEELREAFAALFYRRQPYAHDRAGVSSTEQTAGRANRGVKAA